IVKLSISLKNIYNTNFIYFFLLLLFFIITPTKTLGWGGDNHRLISKQAYNLLEDWEKNILSAYGDSIVNTYCLIPDLYRVEKYKEIMKPYIEIPYLKNDGIFHGGMYYAEEDRVVFDNLPDFYILTYFMENSIKYLKEKNIKEAAMYIGTLAHYIEDNACPVHVVNNTLLTQLLPPLPGLKNFRVHSAVERPAMKNFVINNYPAKKLGKNVFEAVNNIITRYNKNQLNSRAQAVPIITGIYDNDFNKSNNARIKAAEPAAKLLADTIHTIFCLAFNK
ncbi:hypothetical protein ACFL4Z_02800, partial [candidate division KSB1 bacterium]